MGKDNKSIHKRRSSAFVWAVLIAVVLFFAIVLFHYFLRRPNAKLIETVPTEVAFIFQINDNESLVKSTYTLLPYLNEIFYLDALPGFQFFLEQFPNADDEFVISGHKMEESIHLLMSCKIDERYFKNLLKRLQIDPRNNIRYQETKIYTYGTHYKKFYFVYHNQTFSISDNINCVKNTVDQLKTPRNLLSDKDFIKIFDLVEKNQKQNWLILNHRNYITDFQKNLAPEMISHSEKLIDAASWSAFQIRFTDLECIFSGYSLITGEDLKKFEGQNPISDNMSTIFPSSINYYSAFNTSNPELLIQKTTSNNEIANSLKIYRELLPLGCYYFSVSTDSTTYQYVAFQCDSTLLPTDKLIDSLVPPEEFKRHPIYYADLQDFYPGLSTKNKAIPLRHFIVENNTLIFSDTIQSLKTYILLTQNNYIESNPYYRFTQNNLPTNFLYEFYIAQSKDHLWQPYFSEYAMNKGIFPKLKIFAFSYAAPQNDIIPTNVFIKF